MADKTLGMLVPATDIFPTDLFLVEQSGVAKNVPGQVMINFLVRVADGHGGVSDFQKLSESGLEKTYQFLMADGTKYQFTVTDGNSIANFKESVSGLVHTCKIIMDDGTEYSFKVSDGEKGEKGDNAYVHIRFASQKPTSSSSSMGTEPDAWIGFYSGNKAVAPTDPMEYTWAPFKGDKGNTGAPATIVTNKTEYQVSDSGTIVPSGNWSTAIPPVTPGKYLWARTTTQFNTGAANYAYSISRFGIDGSGSVVTVNDVSPDENGNVKLTAEQLQCLGLSGGTMTGSINMNGQAITGLNDPLEETDAVRKAYADKSAREAAPVNILDNSDFRNPVNQRGKTAYAGEGYTIDRWRTWTTASKFNVNSGYISFSAGPIYQYIGSSIDSEKIYTAAYKDTDGNVYVLSGKFSDSPKDNINGLNIYIAYNDVPTFKIDSVYDGRDRNIVWVALYEGAYDADTLPEYRPKGYANELLECQRYYYQISGESAQIGYAYTNSAENLFGNVVLPTKMTPNVPSPTIKIDGSLYAINNGQLQEASEPTVYFVGSFGNLCKIMVGGFAGLTPYHSAILQFSGYGTLAISADL